MACLFCIVNTMVLDETQSSENELNAYIKAQNYAGIAEEQKNYRPKTTVIIMSYWPLLGLKIMNNHQEHCDLFSCDQAALWMVFSVRLSVCLSVCPSVRLSVCPSVRLSHLFDYVPIIVSSWNFQELSHWTGVRSMQKVKVRGQMSRSQRSWPKFSFPDCNSSLNSHMMMKWYI